MSEALPSVKTVCWNAPVNAVTLVPKPRDTVRQGGVPVTDSASAAGGTPVQSQLQTEVRTFLIGDVRGYTRFTQQHGDEAAARLQAKFGAVAREGVSARGGRVIGMWGDEVLAVFESARQAIRTAIDLQERFAEETRTDPKMPLRVGIGLDVGEAIRVEEGYQGGALNLAARLCKLAGPGEILASDGVIHLARKMDGVTYIDRGRAELKGFEGDVHVMEVLSEAAVPDTSQVSVESTARVRPPIGNFLSAIPTGPLVGREDELAALKSTLDTVAGGDGRLVLITGEPGIGKTRVAQEVMIEALHREFIVSTARCQDEELDTPYHCIRQTLRALAQAAPPEIGGQAGRRWPEVAQLIAGHTPHDAQRVLSAISGFVAAVAEDAPVGILVDDLQWADSDSVEVFHHLAMQTRELPVLLLGAYGNAHIAEVNPELEQMLREANRERLFDRIVLRALSTEDTAAMVASIMGQGGASHEFTDFVHRRTAGIPQSIDRMVRSLGGRLKLICEIGAGGMGRVFRAVDSSTGRTVAAKIMFGHGDADLETLLRFQQEGAVLSTLKHPNIVTVYGAFLDEYASCIMMELLEGRPLGQVLAVETVDLARAKTLLEQVASALAYAHARNIVHRDVKPDNIMVLAGDHVKVTDFGIARVRRPEEGQSITRTGMTMGTPLYMSPEQIEGKRVDGRADIYSLGAVMYQIVTGRPPFEGDSPLTIALKHLNEAPKMPREINVDVPPDWEAVIMKTLAKDPADRFQTVAEMQQAIGALSTGGFAAVSAPSPRTDGVESADRSSAAGERPVTHVGASESPQAAPPVPTPGGARVRTLRFHRSVLAAAVAVVVVAAVASVVLLSSSSRKTSTTHPSSSGSVAIWGSRGATPGQLSRPSGLAIDAKGDVYVADAGNNRIQQLAASTDPLNQWGARGVGRGQVNSPGGLALDPQGNVYLADTGNNRVYVLSPNLKLLAVWGSKGTADGQFDHPTGIAIDHQGNVYVADTNNNRVEAFSLRGKFEGSWGTPGTGPVQFDHPTGIAVDGQGNVYVADTGNDRIQELASTSDPLGQWGGPGSGPGRFNRPEGVAADRAGYIYVADTGNDRVQMLSPSGRFRAQRGSRGSQPGQLRGPRAVAVDGKGYVYVSDTGNDRVERFQPLHH